MKKIITVASYFIGVEGGEGPKPPAPHPEDVRVQKPTPRGPNMSEPETEKPTAKKMRGTGSTTQMPYFNSSIAVMQSTRRPNAAAKQKPNNEKRSPPREKDAERPPKDKKEKNSQQKKSQKHHKKKSQTPSPKRVEKRKEFDRNRKQEVEEHRLQIEKELLYKREGWLEAELKTFQQKSKKSDKDIKDLRNGKIKLPDMMRTILQLQEKAWMEGRLGDEKKWEKENAQSADKEFDKLMKKEEPEEESTGSEGEYESYEDEDEHELEHLHRIAASREKQREKTVGHPVWKQELLDQRASWEDEIEKKNEEYEERFAKLGMDNNDTKNNGNYEKLMAERSEFERKMYAEEQVWEEEMRVNHREQRDWEIQMILDEREWEKEIRDKGRSWEDKFIKEHGFNDITKSIMDEARKMERDIIQKARKADEKEIAEKREHGRKELLKEQDGFQSKVGPLPWDEGMHEKMDELNKIMEEERLAWDEKMVAKADEWFMNFAQSKVGMITELGSEVGIKLWKEEVEHAKNKKELEAKAADIEWQMNAEKQILEKGLQWQKELVQAATELAEKDRKDLGEKFETMTKLESEWMRDTFSEHKDWELERMAKEREWIQKAQEEHRKERSRKLLEKKIAKEKAAASERRGPPIPKGVPGTPEDESISDDEEEEDWEALNLKMMRARLEMDTDRLREQLEWDEQVMVKEQEWKNFLMDLAKTGATKIPETHLRERLTTHERWHSETEEFQAKWKKRFHEYSEEYRHVQEYNDHMAKLERHQEEMRRWHEENQGWYYNFEDNSKKRRREEL